MNNAEYILSHDIDAISQKVQNWWNECERSYRDDDGDPIDWDKYFDLNEERVEMILREMVSEEHPALKKAKSYRNFAVKMIETYEEELHAQMYYIEYGVSAIYQHLTS